MNRNTKTLVNNGIEWVYVPERIHIAVNKTQKKLSRPPRQPRQPQLSQLSQPSQKLLNLSISNGETNKSRQSKKYRQNIFIDLLEYTNKTFLNLSDSWVQIKKYLEYLEL